MSKKTIIKLVVVAVVGILIFIFRDYIKVDRMVEMLNDLKNNPLAPLVYVLVYAVAVTLIVPAGPLTLLSAPLFGFWYGLLYTTIGANLGCHLSFWVGKILGEEAIKKRIKSGSFIEKATTQAKKNGLVFMMYVRLIPLFPFAAVNYLSAIIGIKYRDFTIATFIGMIPGSAVYVYLAHSATNIAENPLGVIVSIAVLVVFTLVVTLVKKRSDKKEELRQLQVETQNTN